jgi:hypothetical protein
MKAVRCVLLRLSCCILPIFFCVALSRRRLKQLYDQREGESKRDSRVPELPAVARLAMVTIQ